VVAGTVGTALNRESAERLRLTAPPSTAAHRTTGATSADAARASC